MITREEVEQQFEEYGVTPSAEVLDKCLDLCIEYNIESAVDLVEQWLAFSLSNLDGAEPTPEYLLDMERKELAVQKKATSKKVDSNENSKAKLYGANYGSLDIDIDAGLDSIMSSYGAKTPKALKANLRTPTRHSEELFTPSSQSSLTGAPKGLSQGCGEAVYTFGNSNLLKDKIWQQIKNQTINVKQIAQNEDNELMTAKTKYMLDGLGEKSSFLADRIFYTGKEFCKQVFGEDATDFDLENPDTPSQESVRTIGRIACDYEGKLDASSTILIGSDPITYRTVRLNFNNTNSFSVFPGQVVMVKGLNPRGETMYVEEILAERKLESPSAPKLEESLKFVIAAGPYTQNDNLHYNPLHDLIVYCKNNIPSVIILCGPFIPDDHKLIVGNALAEPFESFFEKMVTGIVEALGNDVIICIVSSAKDVITTTVYPTHPIAFQKSFNNVYFLPDPSTIDINGLSVGITSIDILSHLVEQELTANGGDKIKQMISHLFHQSYYYPLEPPPLHTHIDSDLLSKFGNLDKIPNILILPSDQKYFIRDVHGCLAINPGRVAINKGGTFSRLVVHPPKGETSLVEYVIGQIIRV